MRTGPEDPQSITLPATAGFEWVFGFDPGLAGLRARRLAVVRSDPPGRLMLLRHRQRRADVVVADHRKHWFCERIPLYGEYHHAFRMADIAGVPVLMFTLTSQRLPLRTPEPRDAGKPMFLVCFWI